jgi:hypothetical protein
MLDEQTQEQFRRPRTIFWLWAGVWAGPVAWALSQQVAYLFVTLDCSYARQLMLSPVMLLALLLAAGGVFISWRNWQQAGKHWPGEAGDAVTRSRFLAVLGLLFSGFSLLLIVAHWLPVFFYRQCQR